MTTQPGGETTLEMAERAVVALCRLNAQVTAVSRHARKHNLTHVREVLAGAGEHLGLLDQFIAHLREHPEIARLHEQWDAEYRRRGWRE